MNFIGNEKKIMLLDKAIRARTIHHAYIFSGPQHVGKYTLARMFAQSVIAKSSQLVLSEQADSTTLLDLLVIAPDTEEKKGITKQRDISVDRIRKAQTDLFLYPYHGAYKVLIIDDAHRLTIGAQNALLKILEEPNPTSIIMLITHDQSRILPTILSRCQRMHFSLVNDEEMKNGFADMVHAGEDALPLSMGRPGMACMLLHEDDMLASRRQAVKDLEIIMRGTIRERLTLAEEYAKDVTQSIEKMTLWMWILRSRYHTTVLETDMMMYYGMVGMLQENIDMLKTTNANARLILENAFIQASTIDDV